MSYISAIRDHDEVRVWERVEGERVLKTYPAPYFFFTQDDDGQFESMFGDKLTRHDFDSYTEMRQARQDCESNRVPMFESDIPPELKVLSQEYYEKPAPTLNVTFFDIEVDYNREIGFSSVSNPYAPVNSIALFHTHQNLMIVYAIPPDEWPDKDAFMKEMNDIAPLPTDCDVELHFCKSEEELLRYFIAEIEDSDVVCGWNSDFFDVPYMGKRIEQVLGRAYFRKMSFALAGDPKWREVERFNVPQQILDIQGRISFDYMELFRKYEVAERPSYKLESIAAEVLPELLKLEYEGSLADLYRKNFAYFVRYNFRDTEILKGFEDRLGYVALANEMFHISTGLSKHVGGTLKLAELAINNYCIHELDVRVPDNEIDDESHGIQGAMVLDPKVGMHEWIGSMDINSLYPSSIRSINISPETLIGQFRECERAVQEIERESLVTLVMDIDGASEPLEHTAEKWKEILKQKRWAISGFGTVFDQNKQGVIPKILETWYATRKKYQGKMRGTEDKELSAYFDRLQYVYKIKLNSLYGALNNRFFRFYDLRMGESTTGTGRAILRHMCSMAGKLLDDNYSMSADSVVYGDTDSVYFATHAEGKDEAILIAETVCEKTNATFDDFMRNRFLCTEGYDNIIKAGREVVANRGIFVDKKRYVLNVVDNEGTDLKDGKLKVMGLDTKKTTLPIEVSTKLNKFVERLLKGEDWNTIAEDIVDYKEEIRTTKDVMIIGLPRGVKKVEDYTQQYKLYGNGVRLPGHVAASIFYNECLEKYEDRESLPIVSGMKIKVFYLSQKYGRFKSVALPTDIEQVPDWFLDHFTIDRDAHIQRLVDNPLTNILKAIQVEVPSKQSLLVDDLLEF